jgi:hypothetical protein
MWMFRAPLADPLDDQALDETGAEHHDQIGSQRRLEHLNWYERHVPHAQCELMDVGGQEAGRAEHGALGFNDAAEIVLHHSRSAVVVVHAPWKHGGALLHHVDSLGDHGELFGQRQVPRAVRREQGDIHCAICLRKVGRAPLGKVEIEALTTDQIRTWHAKVAKATARIRTRPGEAQKFKVDADDPEHARRRKSSANVS